jgi:hypothetical protein
MDGATLIMDGNILTIMDILAMDGIILITDGDTQVTDGIILIIMGIQTMAITITTIIHIIRAEEALPIQTM